jgi:hypothetical protein
MTDNLDVPTFLRVAGTRQIMVRIPEDSWQMIQSIRSLSERADGRHATIQAIVCGYTVYAPDVAIKQLITQAQEAA